MFSMEKTGSGTLSGGSRGGSLGYKEPSFVRMMGVVWLKVGVFQGKSMKRTPILDLPLKCSSILTMNLIRNLGIWSESLTASYTEKETTCTMQTRARNKDFTLNGHFVHVPWLARLGKFPIYIVLAKGDLIGHFEKMVRKPEALLLNGMKVISLELSDEIKFHMLPNNYNGPDGTSIFHSPESQLQ